MTTHSLAVLAGVVYITAWACKLMNPEPKRDYHRADYIMGAVLLAWNVASSWLLLRVIFGV